MISAKDVVFLTLCCTDNDDHVQGAVSTISSGQVPTLPILHRVNEDGPGLKIHVSSDNDEGN